MSCAACCRLACGTLLAITIAGCSRGSASSGSGAKPHSPAPGSAVAPAKKPALPFAIDPRWRFSLARYPAAPSVATLRAAAARFKRESAFAKLPATPAIGALRPVAVDKLPPSWRTSADLQRHLRRDVPKREKSVRVRGHALIYQRLPGAKVAADGTITVSWETLRHHPRGAIYFGLAPRASIFRVQRNRLRGKVEVSKRPGLQHATFKLPRLLVRRYDVNDVRTRGHGRAYYRVELLDAQRATSHIYDNVVYFRCAKTPCAAAPTFVQLPTLLDGPHVDLLTDRGLYVTFTTDVPTHGGVLLVDRAGKVRVVHGKAPGLRHEIPVGGLRANAYYRYYALAVDRRGEVARSPVGLVRAAPRPGSSTPFMFSVMTDSRAAKDIGEASYRGVNMSVLRRHLERALLRGAAMVLFPGDLADGYTTEAADLRRQLEAFAWVAQPTDTHIPIYEGMGNHEQLIDAWSSGWCADHRGGPENSQTVFAKVFTNPTNAPEPTPGEPTYKENVYSFDYGNAHFVVLNSNYFYRSHPFRDDHPVGKRGYREGWVTKPQLAWLDKDLAAARKRGARHSFVFTHEPAFPNGGHAKDAMYYHGDPASVRRRNALWRILVKHEVRGAFFGDEHNYSRTLVDQRVDPSFSYPIFAVTTGGAGAPYYAQNRALPWTKSVKRFSAQRNQVFVYVDGDRVEAETVSVTGETIDRFSLSDPR
ncbi:MAG: metallophosphoesterase [Myxococcales bacterium]|nr:metallophosphoesterase [Myxococcales bacterium]